MGAFLQDTICLPKIKIIKSSKHSSGHPNVWCGPVLFTIDQNFSPDSPV